MNTPTITPVLPEYAERAIARINKRIDQDATEATGGRSKMISFVGQVHGWRANGSAGRALNWFVTATENHPHDPYAALVELEAKAAEEVALRPRYYSRGHINGVIAIVREEVGL